jgi:UDP-N-acetylmuramate--alanine ligase
MKNPKDYSLHFIGIGGIGMSGIAEVLHNQGYPVSGSDLSENETTRRLRSLGLTIFIGHDAGHVSNQKVVVISSAIRPDNPEVVKARELRIPILQRAEMLGELMRGKTGIAVAGTHGKTTTTSLMASILTEAKSDPTIVIGGKVDALGGNAKYGKGELVLAEADESDGSFTQLPATYSIITNIDADHLDHFSDLSEIDNAFVSFVGQTPFYGVSIICGDDPGVQRCLPRFTRPLLSYGFLPENDFILTNFSEVPGELTFSLRQRMSEKPLGIFKVRSQGRHNALNAAATVVLSLQLEIPIPTIQKALSHFGGVRRRFDLRYQDQENRIEIRDDYGHHPTEIVATLKAAQSYWKDGRILVAFQPHRYSRTFHLMNGFTDCFDGIDSVFLTDIYSAGEDPIPGVSSGKLAKNIKNGSHKPNHSLYTGTLEKTAEILLDTIQPGDLILTMGAGSITKLPELLIEKLQKKSEQGK